MVKNVINVWKINILELYVMLAAIFASGIIGMLILTIILAIDKETTTAAVGTFMALLLWALLNMIFGLFGFENDFNMLVALGCRRKDYIISKILAVYMNMLMEAVGVLVLGMLERAFIAVFFADREYERLVEYLLDYRIILGIILLIPAIRLCLGALMLRFQQKAFWIFWGLWIVIGYGSGRYVSSITKHPHSRIMVLIREIINLSDIVQILAICILSGVMLAVTYYLTKKQAVYA